MFLSVLSVHSNNFLSHWQVVSRASQARGYTKTTSRPYFMAAYNVNGSKREIRDHVEQLLEGARFIYKVIYDYHPLCNYIVHYN